MTVAYSSSNDEYKLEIIYDEDRQDPRKDYDHVCTMEHWHRRYDFMDGKTTPDFVESMIESDRYFIRPIYMYDHSGISISLGDFNNIDPGGWDSGVVGVIWVLKTHPEINNDQETALKFMQSEVREYDMYLRGEVFGYVVSQLSKCDHGATHEDVEESCWGFYWDSLDEIKQELRYNLSDEFESLIDALD